MTPIENPPEDQRTPGDRLAETSPLFWGILAIAGMAGFTALAVLLTQMMNP